MAATRFQFSFYFYYNIFFLPVVAPLISIMHFDSLAISRELKGRTRTATLTDDILGLPLSGCPVLVSG